MVFHCVVVPCTSSLPTRLIGVNPEMWSQQTAWHQLSGKWCHSMSHESDQTWVKSSRYEWKRAVINSFSPVPTRQIKKVEMLSPKLWLFFLTLHWTKWEFSKSNSCKFGLSKVLTVVPKQWIMCTDLTVQTQFQSTKNKQKKQRVIKKFKIGNFFFSELYSLN